MCVAMLPLLKHRHRSVCWCSFPRIHHSFQPHLRVTNLQRRESTPFEHCAWQWPACSCLKRTYPLRSSTAFLLPILRVVAKSQCATASLFAKPEKSLGSGSGSPGLCALDIMAYGLILNAIASAAAAVLDNHWADFSGIQIWTWSWSVRLANACPKYLPRHLLSCNAFMVWSRYKKLFFSHHRINGNQ